MRISIRLRPLLFAGVALLLAACNGNDQGGMSLSRDNAPNRGVRAVIATISAQRTPYHGASWAAPNSVSHPALLYVTNGGNGTVTFYTYQNGNNLTLQGTITGFNFPTQPCVDHAGNVFIPDEGASTVTEFAHGGTVPLQTLQGDGLFIPTGCSVDKVTGNLAVAGGTDVLVYPGATGAPTAYATSPGLAFPLFCGYDNQGNLYVDGQGNQTEFALAVLPHNATAMQDIGVTGGTIQEPGNVQWGGSQLLVVDTGETSSSIDQLHISGTNATIVSVAPITGSTTVTGSWKRGSHANGKIVFADDGNQTANIFTFPGMSLYSSGPSGLSFPFGVAISQHP